MTNDAQKQAVAMAAISYIEDDMMVGVGTGSTVNFFIDELAKIKHRIDGAVASSIATEERLRAHGIPVVDLNAAGNLPIYIDGADEINDEKVMIKGGGGAMVREKIVASVAKQFICIVDDSKIVKRLGDFPLAVEVIPMARSYVGRELVKLGGSPEYREDFITDNGNIILDVYQLDFSTPIALEEALNNIVGVVGHGLFAKRPADTTLAL